MLTSDICEVTDKGFVTDGGAFHHPHKFADLTFEATSDDGNTKYELIVELCTRCGETSGDSNNADLYKAMEAKR